MAKDDVRKLYKAMGFQKRLTAAQPNEQNTNPDSDHGSDQSNLCFLVDAPNLADPCYISWLETHPSALSCFHLMMHAAEGKQIVLFLDYDGTLSPIVNDPDRAFMSDRMRLAVRDVAKYFPTAIISGRSREKVHGFVKLDEVYYAGSHGMDIMGPPSNVKSYDDNSNRANTLDENGNEYTIFQPAKDYLPSIKKMLKELKKATCSVPGAFVEDNSFCISVHYRHVLDEDYATLVDIIQNIVSGYPNFHVTRGKKVMEIRPPIKWNKGDALKYLLDTLGFSDSTNVIPIYIGDDKTDEDAFKVLKRNEQGFPIIVSSLPRQTSASHSLLDPSEVLAFLMKLAKWGETLA